MSHEVPAPSEQPSRIAGFVRSLVQRERALLVVRTLARTASLLIAVIVWGAVAATARIDRPSAALVAVALLGIGGWFTTALPLLVGWRPAGDPLRQARRVEELAPDLRGRLITAVHHTSGRPSGVPGGDALLGLIVSRAQAGVARVAPRQVHPAGRAVRAAVAAAAVWTVGWILVLVLGPLDTARYWFAGSDALAEVGEVGAVTAEDLARVGDLVVKYTYPDYTGLPQKIVPNGTGDVSAPPGTVVEVTARSADPAEAAGLVAYDERLEARLDPEGRAVTGQFSVGAEEGHWHLLLYRGAEPERSRDFAIAPEVDLPPDVVLDAGEAEVLEVAMDQSVPLMWTARDDYGVRRVGLAVDGKEGDRVLLRPERRQAEVAATARVSPRDLGLNPGDKVRLSIVAWDNDTVSGSKRGESRAVELVVLGASGVDRRQNERREELLTKLVPILARFLTEPWPPGAMAKDFAGWGEVVSDRYDPLSEAVERLWQGIDPNSQDRAIVDRVLESGRKLVRYTQVSFEPQSVEIVQDKVAEIVGGMRDEAVVATEDAILAYHDLLRYDAMAAIQEGAKDLTRAADNLAEALDRDDTAEMLARLDQAERMMDQLKKAAERLSEDHGLRELIELRDSENRRLMEEIRKAIAEGRVDDARKMAERLSEQIRAESKAIEEEMARMSEQGEKLDQQAEDLKAELEKLEQEQKALQTEVQALRKEDRDSADQMAALWAELEKLSAQHTTSAAGYRAGLDAGNRPFYEKERAEAGVDEAEQVKGSVAARDVSGARTAVAEGQMAWSAVGAAVEGQIRAKGSVSGPGVRELRGLFGQLDRIEQLLEQLEQAERQVDPQTLQKARELEGRQRDLDNRLQQASENSEAFEQQFPVRPQGMREAIDDASERMQQAAEDLSQGQPMQAEGSQGVAAQRLREAIESIEQAQQQAQQMQQEMRGESTGDKPEDGPEHGSGTQMQQTLDIPDREEFQTPEEYRRALLEGMEGEVPEEYRALKQRYFDELVHQ